MTTAARVPKIAVSLPGVTARDHRLVVGFVALAVGIRLVFWLWTGRIWEDALITLTPAKMLWAGHGLTHHLSEPRVQSFTSPVSVLIPIVGEAFGHGLLLLRLASLVASGFAVVFAHRAGRVLGLSRPAQVVVLSFVSTDQLQIFFGMAGMETEVATAVLLASTYALLARRWTMLGVTLGLSALCRPEFVLWIVPAAAVILTLQRRASLKSLAMAAAIPLPWFVFAWVYYGSPVPHTIVAKNLYPGAGFGHHSLAGYLVKASDLAQTLVPFAEYTSTTNTPLPTPLLQLIGCTAFGLATAGVWVAARRSRLWVTPACFVLAFYCYELLAMVPSYFMWYLPPVTAVVFLYVGAGLDEVLRHRMRLRTTVAALLVAAYACHIPLSFTLERRVQMGVEDAVRRPVGRYLDQVMTAKDAVVLEPLGFIGFEALGKTTYDYPGLSSEVVTDDLARWPERDRSVLRLVVDLRPQFVVFRDNEYRLFQQEWPEVQADYRVVARFDADPGLDLSVAGLTYGSIDRHFLVLRRQGS